MLHYDELKADPRFPDWLKNNPVFLSHKTIRKIFPEIGLPNCEESTEVDNSKEIATAATQLLTVIQNALGDRLATLTRYSEIKSLGEKRRTKYRTCQTLLSKFRAALAKPNPCMTQTGGKFTLNLPVDIADQDGTVVFKAGEGIFKVYQKLNEILRKGHFLAMPLLDSMSAFKTFSAINIPASHNKIVFASDGLEGAWDIATMSMRGISSCQTWGTSNATHVVGSVVDPFTGIIYLTAGSMTSHGSKMIRRCVVRFVVSQNGNVPCLMLERMYPGDNLQIMKLFIDFLTKKTGGKFRVLIGQHGTPPAGVFVPTSPIVNKLPVQEQPYKDSAIAYRPFSPSIQDGALKVKTSLIRLADHLGYKAGASSVKTRISDVPTEIRKAYRSFKMPDEKGNRAPRHSFEQMCLEKFQAALRQPNKELERPSPYATIKATLEDFKQTKLPHLLENDLKQALKKEQVVEPALQTQILNDLSKGVRAQIDEEISKLEAKDAINGKKYQAAENQSLLQDWYSKVV